VQRRRDEGRVGKLEGAWNNRRDTPRKGDSFVTHFLDTEGRNYMVLNLGPTWDDYVRRGDIDTHTWRDPHVYLLDQKEVEPGELTQVNLGPQLFVMRLPLPDDRGEHVRASKIPHPDTDQGRLVLTHRDTRRICHLYYETLTWKPGNRRGTLFATRFVVLSEKRD
jgi:hypothetical protein